VELKTDGARFEGTIPCYLCLNKVRNSEWDSGDHRKRCAFKNQRELLNYPRPYNAYCPNCSEKLRLWPAKGHPFYCDECPGQKRFVLKRSSGHNRLNCFLCDYDICASCAAAKQDTTEQEDREENTNNITTVITINHTAEHSQSYQEEQQSTVQYKQQQQPTPQHNTRTQHTLPYTLHQEPPLPHTQTENPLPYNPQPENHLPYNPQPETTLMYNPQPEATLPYNPQPECNLSEPSYPYHGTPLTTQGSQNRFTTPFVQPTLENPPPYDSCITPHTQETTSHLPSLPYPIKPYQQHNQTNPSDIMPTAPPFMKP